jgi:hypothetical protein
MTFLWFKNKYCLRKRCLVNYDLQPSHTYILHLNMNYFIQEQEEAGQE